jgi:hypothetical protein
MGASYSMSPPRSELNDALISAPRSIYTRHRAAPLDCASVPRRSRSARQGRRQSYRSFGDADQLMADRNKAQLVVSSNHSCSYTLRRRVPMQPDSRRPSAFTTPTRTRPTCVRAGFRAVRLVPAQTPFRAWDGNPLCGALCAVCPCHHGACPRRAALVRVRSVKSRRRRP